MAGSHNSPTPRMEAVLHTATATPIREDNAEEIAGYLVQNHGLDAARKIAFEGTQAEHAMGDYYRLSIWREVRKVLNKWPDGEAA